MANIKSAKKRIRVIDKKTARNRRIKNHLKAVLKNFDAAMAEGNFDVAQEKLRLAEKKLMQAAAKGTISKHAASRKVSRLTKRFNAAKAAKYALKFINRILPSSRNCMFRLRGSLNTVQVLIRRGTFVFLI